MKSIAIGFLATVSTLMGRAQMPSSTEYVSDGLVAHWDGIDNMISGDTRSHDPDARTWIDLTGNGNDIVLPSSVIFEEKSVYSAASDDYSTLASIPGLDASVDGVAKFTVEVVAKRIGWKLNESNYGAIQTIVRVPRGRFGYREQAANKFIAGFPHDATQVVWEGVTTDGISVADVHTFSFDFAKAKADRYISINGIEPDTWYPESNLQYMSPVAWYENYKFFENDRADIRIYSIRIYNRALTDEERAANLQLDRERFCEVPEYAASEFVRTGYIESDGTQYIKTDYLPNPNTRMELDVMFPGTCDSASGSGTFFGARENGGEVNFTANFGDGGASAATRNINFWLNKSYAKSGKNLQPMFPDDYRKSRQAMIVNANAGSVNYYETKSGLDRKKTTTHTTHPMVLFGLNNDGTITPFNYAKMRLYGCKIWENDTLVRDYVPWYCPFNGEAGLYDKVQDKYFFNGGAGKFAFGGTPDGVLPDGYREIEYVMSSGGQSIATGVMAADDVSVLADFEPIRETANQIVFGAQTKADNKMTADDLFYQVYAGGTGKWRCCHANGPDHDSVPGGYWSDSAIDVTVGRRRSLFLDAFFGGFYIDGACQVVFNYDRNVTGSEITLLNAYGSAKTEGRLYAALVWKAGELVREFMPCVREEDETVGLYDLVNNEFYASTGMNALGANDVDFGMPHFYGTEKSDGFRAPVNYPITGNFSFSMWVRNPDAGNFSSDYYNPTVFPHVGAVLGQGSVGGEPGFSCYMSNDGAGTTVMKVQVRPASGSVLTMVLPDDKLQAIQDDEWHHVVFTYDYTGGSAKFYIDGKVAFSQTEGLVEPGNSTSQHFAIGNRGSAMNIPYCGDVAYVSLWNRALTRNDVLMLRQAPARETDDGLLDAWTLDGGDSGLTGIVSGNKLSQSGNYGYQKSQINWRKVGFMLLLK